ncbi:MAG: TlpA disulfide reductase family protein [Chloroflexi bacterium]|nr:TlpA disulfide reductase family protein [Chloroflexota bacterium]
MTQDADRRANRQRLIVMAIVAVPLIAFFAVLGVALSRSGGVPAGVAINSTLGEAEVQTEVARDFTLTTFDGKTVRLSGLRGSYVMVDFWSSWCPPCIEEAPVLAAAYDRYRPQGVEFVGVAVWDVEDEAARFIEESGAPSPAGADTRGVIGVDYGLTGIPEKYFIDPQGRIVRKYVGPMSEDALNTVLQELLATP